MKSMLNTSADFLILQSWQIAVVFGIILLITWALRNGSAHWRHLLWLVVIAKCLTLPLISVPLAILPANSTIVPSAQNATSVATMTAESLLRSSIEVTHSTASPESKLDQVVATSPDISSPSSTGPVQFNLRQWLAIVWIIVVGALLAYVSAKVWATDRILSRTRLSVDSETRRTVAVLAELLGMSTLPNVDAVPHFAQPFVWGWLRGDIYLPKGFDTTGSDEQRRAILTHELAHVARWDAAANLTKIIVQSIFFFHPLIWWANARIRQEREKCCDEIVLSGLKIRPRVYCEAIVNMLALEHRASQSTPRLAVTGPTKNVAERITSMMTPHRIFNRRPSRLEVVTLLLVAVLILPTAFVVTTRAQIPVPSSAVIKAENADKPEVKVTTAAEEKKVPQTGPWVTGQVMGLRVINAQTKEPIPDMSLELQYAGEGIDSQDVKTQITDDDGWSRISLPSLPTTEVRVYPSKAGFVPLRVYWRGEPYVTVPDSITIPMEPGKTFGSTIRNEEGQPIPGVKVTLHYWGPHAVENPHLRPHIGATAISDKDGRWQVDVMPSEVHEQSLKMYLTHPDYISDHLKRGMLPIPVTQPPPVKKLFDQTAVMIMRKGETIQGRVVDKKGQPIQNASLYEGEYFGLDKGTARAQTDVKGNFRITGVELNDFVRSDRTRMTLTVYAPGYAPELVEVQGASPLKIPLNPGGTIQGKVVDENGQVVEGVAIRTSEWRKLRNRLNLETKTDANGNFRLEHVPTDAVEYTIGKEGYLWVEHFSMSPSPKEYSVTLKVPLRIVGTVFDADTGKPLDKFSLIRGTDMGDGQAPFWQRFDIKTVTTGRYEMAIVQEKFLWLLRVEAKGYMPAVSRIFRPYDPDKGEVTYDFKLNKAIPLTGTVLGSDDKPLANAEVYLATQRMNITNRKVTYAESPGVKTDASGRFEFPAEVEPFCIVVVHEQGVGMTTEKEFAAATGISIKPWTGENSTLEIVRKPVPGQSVDFPVKYP